MKRLPYCESAANLNFHKTNHLWKLVLLVSWFFHELMVGQFHRVSQFSFVQPDLITTPRELPAWWP